MISLVSKYMYMLVYYNKFAVLQEREKTTKISVKHVGMDL